MKKITIVLLLMILISCSGNKFSKEYWNISGQSELVENHDMSKDEPIEEE